MNKLYIIDTAILCKEKHVKLQKNKTKKKPLIHVLEDIFFI